MDELTTLLGALGCTDAPKIIAAFGGLGITSKADLSDVAAGGM